MDFFLLNLEAVEWMLILISIHLDREDIEMFGWRYHRWRMRFVDARLKARSLRREGIPHHEIIKIVRRQFGWLPAFTTALRRKKAYYL